jgi:hypothetical protein
VAGALDGFEGDEWEQFDDSALQMLASRIVP